MDILLCALDHQKDTGNPEGKIRRLRRFWFEVSHTQSDTTRGFDGQRLFCTTARSVLKLKSAKSVDHHFLVCDLRVPVVRAPSYLISGSGSCIRFTIKVHDSFAKELVGVLDSAFWKHQCEIRVAVFQQL